MGHGSFRKICYVHRIREVLARGFFFVEHTLGLSDEVLNESRASSNNY
jgi:hypothetical protein